MGKGLGRKREEEWREGEQGGGRERDLSRREVRLRMFDMRCVPFQRFVLTVFLEKNVVRWSTSFRGWERYEEEFKYLLEYVGLG